MNRINIKEIFESLDKKQAPRNWLNNQERIREDFAHLQEMLKKDKPPKIYGVNTLVGHLDTESLSSEEIRSFQKILIQNHTIGTEPYFSDFTALCISFVKVNQISNGGTCVSPDLYQLLMKVIFSDHFRPKIPMHASYSSGDVIPGAHWASELLTFIQKGADYQLKPKEGLSLINGSFIHTGYSLSLFNELNNVWKQFVYNSFLNAILINANYTNYTEHLSAHSSDALSNLLQQLSTLLKRNQQYRRQDPVSIRSLPQILRTFVSSINSFKDSIEESVNSRSDNPLIVCESEIPLSQGSFLDPLLTVEASKLIEVLLMTMWHIERRFHYLLSGDIEGIPLNASSKGQPLGYIQVPKLVTAILEEARMAGGRRAFASGGVTSYGIEDFWTFGVQTNIILEKLIKKLAYMLSLEFIVSANIYNNFNFEKLNNFEVPLLKSEDISSLSTEIREKILSGDNTFIHFDKGIDFLQ